MILSILIPSITERIESHLIPLVMKLEGQIKEGSHIGSVEILSFTDNCQRSIGAKRQALLNLAQGVFIAFIDDDDDISDNYIENFFRAYSFATQWTDVITFNQHVYIDGTYYANRFEFGKEGNDPIDQEGGCIRPPWHVCFWRRDIVKHCTFPDSNYGEDWAWAEQANKKAKSSYHIDAFMHTYHYNSEVSRATAE